MLDALGAPQSAYNLNFLAAWEKQEGGLSVEHINNPLNTTLDRSRYPGYQYAPAIPVYPSLGVGVAETAATIRQGYPSILAALQKDQVGASVGTPGFVSDLNKWVSGKRSTTESKYSKAVEDAALGNQSAADWTSVSGTDLGNAAAAGAGAAAGAAAGFLGITDAKKALEFLFSYRFLEILGGGMLILVGLYILAKQFGATFSVPGPVKQAANATPVGRAASTAAAATPSAPAPRRQMSAEERGTQTVAVQHERARASGDEGVVSVRRKQAPRPTPKRKGVSSNQSRPKHGRQVRVRS